MTTANTFKNTLFDQKRNELLNRQNPIAVSDVKNNIVIKDQLNSNELVGDLDEDEKFMCKICFLIVLDPMECRECNALFCSKCIQQYSKNECTNC